RAVVRERAVDVDRGHARAARPDGEPRAARVLRLDGEKPAGDLDGIASGRAGEELRGEAFGDRHGTASMSAGRSGVVWQDSPSSYARPWPPPRACSRSAAETASSRLRWRTPATR